MARPNAAEFGEGSVTIRRTFDAPRALVWRAWTDPKIMAQWFGPRMFTTPVCELDVRVGGALRIVMRGPDGNEYPMKGVFTEVVPEERLVFTNIPTDGSGNHLMEGETRVTFADAGGKTELAVTAHMVGCVPLAKQMLAGMEMGWTQTIDKLGEVVARSPSP
jgi:uncharacterized protein YndB with AHSA1/START domain